MAGIIEEMELRGGYRLYVQINKTLDGQARVAISFDGQFTQHTFELTYEEAEILSALIKKATKEYGHGAAKTDR